MSRTYYTLPIMVIAQLLAFAVCFYNRKKFPELKFFHFYPLAGICQTLASFISMLFLNSSERTSEASINIFSLTELILIYDLALRTMKIEKLRYSLKILLIAFSGYVLINWAFTAQFYHSAEIIPYEEVLILIPTSLYFFQLFKLPATFDLLQSPAFWINIGIFFMFSCTGPLSILEYFYPNFVHLNHNFYYINFVSYTVLYLFIVKGYMCIRKDKIEASQVYKLQVMQKLYIRESQEVSSSS